MVQTNDELQKQLADIAGIDAPGLDTHPPPKKITHAWQFRGCVAGIALAAVIGAAYASIPHVLSDSVINNAFEDDGGVQFMVRFKKNRHCKFLSSAWMDKDNRHLTREFRKGSISKIPQGALPGGFHNTGPFFIANYSLHDLKYHTYAIVRHECLFGWISQTVLHQPPTFEF